ncbi:HD domain protein, partial [hydrothermal vent metagenome]
WKLAVRIAEREKADLFVVNLGALLHDIADAKFHDGDETVGPQKAEDFLQSLSLPEEIISKILNIIRFVSFKNRDEKPADDSLELRIVQDADRLDALGAIGIARAFSYGGFKNREMYNPDILPKLKMNKAEYKKSESTTINHFYEKLLLLKEMMHTKTGKQLATKRHRFMEEFLKEFYAEWG